MGNVSKQKCRCCPDGGGFYKINPVLEKPLPAQMKESAELIFRKGDFFGFMGPNGAGNEKPNGRSK